MKDRLRRDALFRRDALDAVFRNRAAEAVAGRIKIGPRLTGAVAGLYSPIRSEFDPGPLAARLAALGVRLALPVVGPDGLVFRSWTPGEALVPAGFGTFGPGEEAMSVRPDILFLPLSVFDRAGGRIGYGKGHYDKAIAGLARSGPVPVAVGLAFCVQEVDQVPSEPHDHPLDAILTEAETIIVARDRIDGWGIA